MERMIKSGCRIVIVGFRDEDLPVLNSVMEEWMQKNNAYIFAVVCGGADPRNHKVSAAEKWARVKGAPVEYIYEKDIEILLKKITAAAHWIIAKRNDSNFVRRLIMMFRMTEGKHGIII